MNIITTQYTLKYRSFEIVLSGCKGENGKHCEGCHASETWDFNVGSYYKSQILEIKSKIEEFSNLIDWIWVYGGEPLDQNHGDLEQLLVFLKLLGKPVMLFTRYDIADVPEFMRHWCDYIKTGKYDCSKLDDEYYQTANGYNIQLASTNQKIIKVDNEN